MRVIFPLFDDKQYDDDPRRHVIRAYPNDVPTWAESSIAHGGLWFSRIQKYETDEVLHDLADYYAEQDADFCIAPNAYRQAYKTMDVWERYHHLGYGGVAPVIVMTPKMNITQIQHQINYYASWDSWQEEGFICLSNTGNMAIEVGQEIRLVCHLIRQRFDGVRIHVLGAGYNPQDVTGWAMLLHEQDSIDSMVYYEDAKRGYLWPSLGTELLARPEGMRWQEAAIENAHMALKARDRGMRAARGN